MALKRKVDDASDEDDKEQGDPTAKRSKGPGTGRPNCARPKDPCWHCGGPHLQRDCPHINDEGKEKACQHLQLGDHGDQDHFPDQQYNNGTHGFQSLPKAKVKASQEKEARAKVERAKGLGPKLVYWIHTSGGKAHLWDTSSQIGAPTRTCFPFAASPGHFPWKPVRGQRTCTAGSSPSRLFWKGHQKLGHDPSQFRKVLPLLTEEETLRTMNFNACSVTKALGSVKRMCDAGRTVLTVTVIMFATNTRERRT